MCSQLTPDESLLQRTLQLAEEHDEPKDEESEQAVRAEPVLKKRRLGVAVAVLALALGVGAVFGITRLNRKEAAPEQALDKAPAQPDDRPLTDEGYFNKAVDAAYQLELGMPFGQAVDTLVGLGGEDPLFADDPADDLICDAVVDFGKYRLLLSEQSDRLNTVEIMQLPDGMAFELIPVTYYTARDLVGCRETDEAIGKWLTARKYTTRSEITAALGAPEKSSGLTDTYGWIRFNYFEDGRLENAEIRSQLLGYWRLLRDEDIQIVDDEVYAENDAIFGEEKNELDYSINSAMYCLRFMSPDMPAAEARKIMAFAAAEKPKVKSRSGGTTETYSLGGCDVILGITDTEKLWYADISKAGSDTSTPIMPLPSQKELFGMDRSDDYTDMLGAWYSVIDCRTRESVRAVLGEPQVSKRTYDVYSFGNEKLMVRFAFESKVVGFMHYDRQLDHWFELSKRYTTEAPAQPDDTEPSGDNFPEMLKPYVGHRSSEYDTDFDRMMADVANLTAADRDVFFDDFESFGDPIGSGLLISSFYGAKNDGTVHSQTKYYRYGPYMLRIWGNVDEEPNEELPVKYGQLLVSVERWGNLDTGWVAPYVSLRIISEDGTDLPVESHTKEEIDELAYIIEDPKLLDQVQDRNESFGR